MLLFLKSCICALLMEADLVKDIVQLGVFVVSLFHMTVMPLFTGVGASV